MRRPTGGEQRSNPQTPNYKREPFATHSGKITITTEDPMFLSPWIQLDSSLKRSQHVEPLSHPPDVKIHCHFGLAIEHFKHWNFSCLRNTHQTSSNSDVSYTFLH